MSFVHFETLENRQLLAADKVISLGAGSADNGRNLVVDNDGNRYVAGRFTGTVDFDPTDGVTNLTSSGGTDAFLAKYSPTGKLRWARNINSPVADDAWAIAVNKKNGDVALGIRASTNVVLHLFEKNGDLKWDKRIESPNANVYGATFNGDGRVTFVGYFQGQNIDFGDTSLSSAGIGDAFVIQYARNGDQRWVRRFGGTADEYGIGAGSDGSDVILSGVFHGQVDFQPGSGETILNGGVDGKGFVVRLKKSGNLEWAKALDRLVNYSTVDSSGATIIVQPGRVTRLKAGGGLDWHANFGPTNSPNFFGVTTDQDGKIFLSGDFNSKVDFNPKNGTENRTNTQTNQGFILSLTKSKSFRWVRVLTYEGTPGGIGIYGVGADRDGKVTYFGEFTGTLTLDSLGDEDDIVSAGASDIFMIQVKAKNGRL